MLECGTGGVKVGMEGAQCVSKYVCETGKGMRGGLRGRLSMALTRPGGAE